MSRWVRRLGWIALAALGLLLLLIGTAYLLVTTPPGESYVRGRVVKTLNKQLPGNVDLGGLDISGRTVVLTDLVLRDPEGEVVARISRVEATIGIISATRGHLDLRKVRVLRPELYLKLDERGLNLVRAVEIAVKEVERRPSEAIVHVRDLQIEGGQVQWIQDTVPSIAREIRVKDLGGRGELAFTAANEEMGAAISLSGLSTFPAQGPLAVELRIDRKAQQGAAQVGFAIAGADLAFGLNSENADRQEIRISRLSLPRETLRALVPGWPLTADASLTGEAKRTGKVAWVNLHAAAAGARVDVTGGVDVARRRAEDLVLQGRHLDFSQLLEDGPKSSVDFTLRASGGGTSLDSLDGRIDLSVPESALGDQRLGPIEVHASARDGKLDVSSLLANAPGLTIEGSGEATRDAVRFEGRAVAKDLSILGASLGRVVRPGGLPISGRGTLSFRLSGPPDRPAIAGSGRFASLSYDDTKLERLSFRAALADVRRPLDADADVQAGLVSFGERQFRDVRARLVTRGRALEAELTARGLANVELHVAGALDGSGQALLLSDFKVRYPEATWTLQRPARVALSNGELSASELTLESGRQRITVDGGFFGERVNLQSRLENVRLDRLPRAFLPEDLNLGGEVNASISAEGTSSRPEGAVKLAIRNGRFRNLTDLGLELDARYARDRATGEILGRALDGAIKGNFDVPVRGLLSGTREPISAEFGIGPTRLERLLAAMDVKSGLQGNAAATLKVQGTALDPRVRLAVDGDQVRLNEGPSGDLDVIVESAPDGKLQARVDLDVAGSEGFLLVKTPWVAAQFVREKISGRELLETPVDLEGTFREVPLEALRASGILATPFAGKGTLEIDTHGPLLSPEGELRLALHQLSSGSIRPVDVDLRIHGESRQLDLDVTVSRGQERVLKVGGQMGAPLRAFFDGQMLHDVALTLAGDVGPVSLAELQAFSEVEQEQEPEIPRADGVVTGRFELRGTAGNPTALLVGRVEKLGVGKQALGTVEFDYRHTDSISTLVARLTSESGGQLEVDGRAVLDVSSRTLQRGLRWREAPLQARVHSRDFDPAFLSNVSEEVREIGGRIDADATLRGTLGTPVLQGRLEWRDGRLGLMGYGQYRRIHLLLQGSPEAMALEDLSAESGTGTLKLTARGERRGGAVVVRGSGEISRFPIIIDDQLRAILTTRFSLNGEATPSLVSVRNLVIPQAQVELPDTRQKDLQDLQRPSDIVLVRKGAPLYKRRAKRPPLGEGGAAAAGGAVEEVRARTGRRYVVLVDAPRNIWVKGTDVNAEIGLSNQFRIELEDTLMMFGEVRFLRGRVDVLGRRFDLLKDSQVRFSGPPTTPFINVTAEHLNEREGVDVFTTIRGQGKDVTVLVYSKPALSESEIYTLLATGRRTLERSSGTSMTGAEAASVVGSYAASQIKRVVASKIPLDVLSIEAGSEGLADASVEAGTYVSDRVYVGSVVRLGADPEENENTAAFRLEYQFSPRWSFETEYGNARRGGADMIWSIDY